MSVKTNIPGYYRESSGIVLHDDSVELESFRKARSRIKEEKMQKDRMSALEARIAALEEKLR